MEERSKLAFEFARDTTKELIALASAIIALTITFSSDFIAGVGGRYQGIALWSWGAFLASVFFGLLTLLALTGMLGRSEPLDIYKSNIRLFSGLQIALFFLGLIMTVVFAVGSVIALDQSDNAAPLDKEASYYRDEAVWPPNPAAQPDVQRTDVRRPRG